MTWSDLAIPLIGALVIPYALWVIGILIRDRRAQKAREKREQEEQDARTQAAWDQIYKERADRDAELVAERAKRFIRPSALSRAMAMATSTRTSTAKAPERNKQKSNGSSAPSIDVDFSSGSDSGGGGE